MEAKIEQINRYKVTIGNKVYDDFKKCEEWEGMLKFSGPSGALIVDGNKNEFAPVFTSIFGSEENEGPVDLLIIKASPSLMPDEST